MKKRDKKAKRKSFYNDKRDCYLSLDGKFYCYRVWDESGKHSTIKTIEVGKDMSIDLTIFLDESDHEADLNDRYQAELRDTLFDIEDDRYDIYDNEDGLIAPWEKVGNNTDSPENTLFASEVTENPQLAQVRDVIDKNCTEAQRDFFFDHFGMNKQLEEMRQSEAERTGKLPTPAAMNNRKNKIIEKVAKVLGVERVKRHKYTKRKE